MLFNSIDFIIFFPIVILVYFMIPDRVKYIWLLITSYYFYMCWNASYVLLLFISTFITWLSGIIMEYIKNTKWEEKKKNIFKKLTVGLSFGGNLLILFYFKYANFGIEILENLFTAINITINIPAVDVILPVGISFYTFQALGYTMDVYRDDIYAEKNLFRYALFVSFFPQLVAGPIERSKNLLKQLAIPKKFDYENAKEGLLLMIWGMFLKIVLADRIAILVDCVYGDIVTYGGWYLIIATIFFAIQIYCDFSGYSIIAMGVAKILNIELMENFDAPYMSTSVTEFWRRWHISLTSWFKDYLYIPLGGSRKGKLCKYMNKMIVFLVSGLWHGASMSFVVWGGLNGLYQIIGEITQPIRDSLVKCMHLNRESLGHKVIQGIITFVLVDFSWIFFRSNSFSYAIEIIKSMVTVYNPEILFNGAIATAGGFSEKIFSLMMFSIVVLIFADVCKIRGIRIREIILKQDGWIRLIIIVISLSFVLLFGIWGPAFDTSSFIYFQF